MSSFFSLTGKVKEIGVPDILAHMHRQFVDGTLVVRDGDLRRKIYVHNQKVSFASSNVEDDSLGSYLIRNRIIDLDIFQKAGDFMVEHHTRFGRALLELGILDADGLWLWVGRQLKEIVFACLGMLDGDYEIITDDDPLQENILLDMDIPSLLVEGSRGLFPVESIDRVLGSLTHLYVQKEDLSGKIGFKPYELHILQLLKRESAIDEILKKSELLVADTLRILYLFSLLGIVSPHQAEATQEAEGEKVVSCRSFNSFEEALKYYNMKYELIFRVLSKEIGPIAQSILTRAIEGIEGSLPSYLKNVQLTAGGSIKKEKILKSLWYHDFDSYVGELLRGLEEILYAEIYSVKKHLGVEYEQQILKWINPTGN